MTREEAKPYIGELKMYAKSQGWDEEYLIACDVAMNEKALEQEPILDKIRAEIIHETESIWNVDIIVGMKRAVDIIDKYKAESEE